jgi:hypothetical protein
MSKIFMLCFQREQMMKEVRSSSSVICVISARLSFWSDKRESACKVQFSESSIVTLNY